MRRHYNALRSAAATIADIGDSVVADLVDGKIRQEPDATSQLVGAIKHEFWRREVHGINWEATVFTDRGPKAEEKRFGADFGGVLNIDLPDYKVKKGFLAQAKYLRGKKQDLDEALPAYTH